MANPYATAPQTQPSYLGAALPEEGDWLTKYLQTANAAPAFTPLTQAQLPTITKPTGKGKQAKSDVKSNQEVKAGTSRVVNYDADQFAALGDAVNSLPEMQEQRKGITEQENLLSMLKEAPVRDSDFWVRPLLALADSQTGSKLSAGYKPAESYGDRLKSVVAMQDDLQKKRGDLSKATLEGISKLKSGTDTTAQNNSLSQQLGYLTGMVNAGGGRGDPQDRMDFQAHQRTIQAVKNDKPLKDRLAQYQNLDNAMSTIINAEHVTPQQFDEFQQSIRSNLGIKGTGGVDERDRTRLNELGFNVDRLQQMLTGNPADISRDNKLLLHVKDLAQVEQANIQAQAQDRLNVASGGNGSMYARRPDYKSDLDSLMGATNRQFKSTAVAQEAAKKAGQSSGGKPKTVTQKGHTYILNEKTGKYE